MTQLFLNKAEDAEVVARVLSMGAESLCPEHFEMLEVSIANMCKTRSIDSNQKSNDVFVLTNDNTEREINRGDKVTPCKVWVEYQNEHCWLIRYVDSGQCMMIKKNEMHFLKET